METKVNDIYTIKEQYFEEFPDPYLKLNKNEHRPYYFAFRGDNKNILWIIPLSSKIDKYERLIRKRKEEGRPCDVVHVCKIGSRKQAFMIQDMFPVTKEYVNTEYLVNDIPYKLVNKRDIRIIEKKAKRIHFLYENGVKVLATQPDVKSIELKLLEKIQEKESNN